MKNTTNFAIHDGNNQKKDEGGRKDGWVYGEQIAEMRECT